MNYANTPLRGYRDLDLEEVATADRIKSMAAQVGELVEEINNREGTDKRWAAIGRTDLQTGFMALLRAVLRPESF